MNIGKIAKKIFVYESDPLEKAIKIMLDKDVSGIAVLDSNGKLSGVLSAKDFLKEFISFKYHNSSLGNVSSYLVNNPRCLNYSESLNNVIDVFISESPHHYYPVIDDNNIYMGTVYRNDLLNYVNNLKESTW